MKIKLTVIALSFNFILMFLLLVIVLRLRGMQFIAWGIIGVSTIASVYLYINNYFRRLFDLNNLLIVSAILFLIYTCIGMFVTPGLSDYFNPYPKFFYVLYLIVGILIYKLTFLGWIRESNIFYTGLFFFSVISIKVLFLFHSFGGGFQPGVIDTSTDPRGVDFYQVLPYFIVYTFPMLFLKKGRIQFVVFGIAAVLILLTTKRGPLVSAILAFSVTFFAMNKVSIKTIFKIVIIVIVASLIFNFFAADQLNQIYNRFDNKSGADMSSGRYIIWGITIFNWFNSDALSMLFGNGFESSHIVLKSIWGHAISAHNDYIDTLHNLGIFGLLLLSILNFSMVKVTRKALKYGYKHADVMIFTLTVWLITSIVSCNIYKESALCFSIIFFYCAGDFYRTISLSKTTEIKS
jgi:hypothetical protein